MSKWKDIGLEKLIGVLDSMPPELIIIIISCMPIIELRGAIPIALATNLTAITTGAEAGPMTAYASGRALTGRAGLYPSRSRSGPVDRRGGPLVPKGNRRLRQALLRIADTLIRGNDHFRLKARAWTLASLPREKLHIVVAGRLARIAFRMVGGSQTYRHPGSRDRDDVITKLMNFCNNHNIDIQETLSILQTAVDQLPPRARPAEVPPLAAELRRVAGKRGAGPTRLSTILPSVLARLQADALESTQSGEVSQSV
jgi:transposase